MHRTRTVLMFAMILVLVTAPALAQGAADGEEFSDTQLTSAVVAELYWDPRVDAAEMDVVVEDRLVILDGTADSYSEVLAAIEVARTVRGVREVESDILVAAPDEAESPVLLTRRVRSVLNATVGVADQDVEVRSLSEGEIILEGTVDSYSARRRAVGAAADVVGVRAVTDNIAVVPTQSVTDEAIADDVVTAIRRSTTVPLDGVEVAVTDGVVRLSGEIETWDDVVAVVNAASYAVGVVDVDNNLTVGEAETAGRPTDSAIRRDVRDQLVWDDRVDATTVRVTVENGVVTLTGTVDSYPERQVAETDAVSVPGVREVFNHLEVVIPDVARIAGDLTASAIENALDVAETVDADDVTVIFREGSVLLSGSVPSLWAKERVGEIVADIQGVTDIDNRLTVVPEDDMSDEEIAERIVEKLTGRFFIDAEDITVRVEDGFVTLSGTVDTAVEREMAYDAALRTNGVRGIRARIEVET